MHSNYIASIIHENSIQELLNNHEKLKAELDYEYNEEQRLIDLKSDLDEEGENDEILAVTIHIEYLSREYIHTKTTNENKLILLEKIYNLENEYYSNLKSKLLTSIKRIEL